MNTGRISFGPAAAPSFPDQISAILKLADHIRDLDIDRHELQEALDAVIEDNDALQAEVVRLTQLLNGK